MNELFLLLSTLLTAPDALAQSQPAAPTRSARPAPSFFSTYAYRTYTIFDKASGPAPIAARGVGGTLTLRPDGTYQKALAIVGNGGTMRFDQSGRFRFTADRIAFTYTNKQGQLRTDEGTFRLTNGLLTLTIQGYPAGNQSVYTLQAQ